MPGIPSLYEKVMRLTPPLCGANYNVIAVCNTYSAELSSERTCTNVMYNIENLLPNLGREQ